MTKTWLLALPILAGPVLAAPAQAAILDARFSGTVISQSGTNSALGSTVSGEFIYNTGTSAYTSFTIAGLSAAPGSASTAALTPDGTDATYRAQISAVQQGGSVNQTFVLDLESLTNFVQPVLPTSAVALLTNASELATLDLASNPASQFPSTFGYSLANANGTGVSRLTADLVNLQVFVPEPASLALLAAACAGLAMRRRRA